MSATVQTNIEAIVRLEEEAEHKRTIIDRLPETVGRFAGTVWFVGLQLLLVGLYILANSTTVIGVQPWDPYPYSLLSGILSLEGVLLTAFVLIRQNWMNKKADRRDHLGLQINLLAEKEITKVLQTLHLMSEHMGIEDDVVDAESKEMSQITAVDSLAQKLDRELEQGEEA